MTPFLHGFTSELLKIAAMPQHERPVEYDAASSIRQIMSDTQGPAAKAALKSGKQTPTPRAPYKIAPTPLTTPNAMVGYIGGQ